MLKLRQNIRSLFRVITEAEYQELYEAAECRESLEADERKDLEPPEAANSTIVGALIWTTFVLWQDHRGFLCFGVAGLVLTTIYRFIALFHMVAS